MNYQRILALRSELVEACRDLSVPDLRLLLAQVIDAGDAEAPMGPASVKAAFARVLWVRYELQIHLKEGEDYLRAAAAILEPLAGNNRLLAFLPRDIAMFRGNLHHDYASFPQAILAYNEAIAKESNPDRLAVGLLNIARTHIKMGRLHQALITAEQCKLQRIKSDDLRSQLQLFKARVLLGLGYQQYAETCLQVLPAERSHQVAVEASYLQIYAAVDAEDFLATKAAYQDLITSCESRQDPAAAYFYQLEWRLFAPFVEPAVVTGKRTFLEIGRFQARQSHRKDLYAVAAATLKLALARRITPSLCKGLSDTQEVLLENGDYLLYLHHKQQTALFFLKGRSYQNAAQILTELEAFLRRGESDLPPHLVKDLSQKRNTTREIIAAMIAKLPADVAGKMHKYGSFLVDE